MIAKIPRFRFDRAPRAVEQKARIDRARPQAHERGLDEKWRRMSIRFRKQNPFCRLCDQESGQAYPVDVVV